ncbi:MAG: NAD(P)-dependent oxidoreductase, partial [Lawsonibacter sp.]|nr:NAD(P)-dependent oxidoreductase [Lawsonibacter sp.]
IGFNHVDLDTAHALGMKAVHLFYPPSGVANYAIMMMLMCCRRMRQILDRNVVQDYSLVGKMGKELSNCTVAVLGTGKIGATVVKHLSGFGCRILAHDLYPNPEVAQYAQYTDLDTIWEEADVITLHMPANSENYHIINAQTLAKMKQGVILVNTARGDLIDTAALIDTIEAGKVGAAALDVLEQEDGLYYANLMGKPIPNRDLALLKAFPNVIVTPHTAFYTDEAVEHMVMNTVKGILACEQDGDNAFLVK